MRECPGNPKPDEVAPTRGIAPVAVRGTEVPRKVDLGTAPQHARLTIAITRECPENTEGKKVSIHAVVVGAFIKF